MFLFTTEDHAIAIWWIWAREAAALRRSTGPAAVRAYMGFLFPGTLTRMASIGGSDYLQ